MCLKYEHAVAKAKMTEVIGSSEERMDGSSNGVNKLLEQQKFKLLGKI